MGSPVIHFEIGVKNAEKSSMFYSKVFDWKIKRDMVSYSTVSAEKDGIGGGIMEVGEGDFPPYVTFYMEVDDVQKYLDRIEENGGKTYRAPVDISDIGQIGWFHDPDRNLIGLWKK